MAYLLRWFGAWCKGVEFKPVESLAVLLVREQGGIEFCQEKILILASLICLKAFDICGQLVAHHQFRGFTSSDGGMVSYGCAGRVDKPYVLNFCAYI